MIKNKNSQLFEKQKFASNQIQKIDSLHEHFLLFQSKKLNLL
jgi:hypothetical protein